MITAIFRWLLGLLFVGAGANHFVHPDFYLAIMPPWVPWHVACVQVSGVAEILGGIGILVPATRRFSGWGLLALLVAVFPANIYMATDHIQPPGVTVQPWQAWARLPVQVVLMAWVWWVALRKKV